MVGTLSFSILAAVASFATGVVATGNQCTGNNFPVTILNNDLCLPKGGPKNPPGCPDEDGICPDGWYWYKNKEFCVPTTKPYINKIDCPDGYAWNPKKYQCKSKCKKNQFWYSSLETCLPKGGISAPPSPPSGQTCPNKWYWHKQMKVCVPKNPNYDPTPDCGDDEWSVPKQCCVIPPKPTCPRGTFYWPARKICIPYNGPSNPSGPPHGHQCPPHWYWHKEKKCCAPTQPNPPKPTCPGGGHWNPKPCECENGPHPSPKPPHRRRRADTTLCPTGTEACPINGGGDYECLNTKVELESCGGCASTGAGQDCTQIPHAWNVGCKQGSCEVYSCLQGYKVNSEGTGCEPIAAPL